MKKWNVLVILFVYFVRLWNSWTNPLKNQWTKHFQIFILQNESKNLICKSKTENLGLFSLVVNCRTYITNSDRPKPKFEPKPKVPKFRLVWAEAETETES